MAVKQTMKNGRNLKNIFQRMLAVLCVLALLTGTVLGVAPHIQTKAATKDTRAREWWIYGNKATDAGLTVVDTATNTKKASITNARVDLPAGLSEGNLALYVKMNIESDAESLALMNDAERSETYIELCNEQADSKERNWKTANYGLQNGENELLLPFAESGLSYGTDGEQAFAWDETIRFFRFYTTAAFTEQAACKVVISEIKIVYTSVGLEFGKQGDDTYLQLKQPLSEKPSTMEASIQMSPVENSNTGWTLASSSEEDKKTLNSRRFVVEDTYRIRLPEEYVTTSDKLSESKLAVTFRFYSSVATSLGDGQLELNSSGQQNDRSEIRFQLKKMVAVEEGWNNIVLPLNLFTKSETDGKVDLSNLNYVKFYTDPLTGEFAIGDIRLIVLEKDADSLGTIGNAFSDAAVQIGTAQGGDGEPKQGTLYAITDLSNKALRIENKFQLAIPEEYQSSQLSDLKNSPLAVAFWIYSSVDASLGDGQLELTSEGKRTDANEIRYMFRNMSGLKAGWNYIVLPLQLFEYSTSASINLSNLNYLYFYTDKLTGTFATTDLELIVLEQDDDKEWTIGDAYILNSFNSKGTHYSFNNTFGKMGVSEGAEGEPAAGTIYSETTITKTGEQLKLFRYYDALNVGSYTVQDLALEFWVYSSTGAEPFARADNQVELQNQVGGNDSNEARWKFKWESLKVGWNHVILPLKEATIVGNFDISKAGKLRIYTTGTNQDSVLRFSDFKFIVQENTRAAQSDSSQNIEITVGTYKADSHYMIFSNTGNGDANQTALFVTNEGYPAYVEGNTQYTLKNVSVSTGEWVDIAVVRDEDSITFYVNGAAVKTRNEIGRNALQVSNKKYTIGADGMGNQLFCGTIADVRLWNDIRTAEEIDQNRVDKTKKALTSNGLELSDHSLIGSWFLVGDIQYVLETMPDNSRKQNHAVFCGSRASDWVDYDKTQYDFLYDENGEEDYWSMIFIPDIQNLITGKYNRLWYQMSDWIAEHIETENVKHVIGAGDSTWSNTDRDYKFAMNGFNKFTSSVSWSNMIGNHDYVWNGSQRDSAKYNTYFGLDYIKSTGAGSTYRGSFEDPNRVSEVENSYYTFSVNGVKWMILQLEYYPRQSVLAWANNILEDEKYEDYNVILTTHAYLDGQGNYTNDYMNYTANDDAIGGYLGATTSTIWDSVVKPHTNVQMVLCGHSTNETGEVDVKSVVNDAGEEVEAFMMNVQDHDMSYYSGQGIGAINILRFSADGTKVALQQYAPGYDKSFGAESNTITASLQVVSCLHKKESIYNVDTPTGNHTGYTGDTYCTECGSLLRTGTIIAATGEAELDEIEQAEQQKPINTSDSTHTVGWVILSSVSIVAVLGILLEKNKKEKKG